MLTKYENIPYSLGITVAEKHGQVEFTLSVRSNKDVAMGVEAENPIVYEMRPTIDSLDAVKSVAATHARALTMRELGASRFSTDMNTIDNDIDKAIKRAFAYDVIKDEQLLMRFHNDH